MHSARRLDGIGIFSRYKAITLATILGGLSLGVSLGFASWTLSGAGPTSALTNVSADPTFYSGVAVQSSGWTSNAYIHFGANKKDAGNTWLTNNTISESLTVAYAVTFNNDANAKIGVFDFDFYECDSQGNKLNNGPYKTEMVHVVSGTSTVDGVVASFPAYSASGHDAQGKRGTIALTLSNGTITQSGDGHFVLNLGSAMTTTFTISIRFCWGPGFNYSNPMDYYSDLDLNYASDLEAKLARLNTVNETNFAMSFSMGVETE